MTQHTSDRPRIDWQTTSNWQLSPDPWMDLFIDELRRLGASGAAVGDARAVVEAHCRESRTSAQHSFGDPVAYARSVAPMGRHEDRFLLRQQGPVWFALMAWWACLTLPLVLDSRPVPLLWGQLGLLAAFALFMLAIGYVWRFQRRDPGKGMAAMLGLFLGLSVLQSALTGIRTTAFTAPAWLLWTIVAGAAVLGTIGCLRTIRDRVVSPVTGQTPSTVPAFWWYALGTLPLVAPSVTVLLRLAARS